MANRHVPGPEVSVRMFRNPVAEALTHMHPATPLFVGVPVFLAMAWWAFRVESLRLAALPGLFLAGLLLWTLLEYVMHRFIFHLEPRSAWGKKVHFLIHGVHHDYPNDATRLVMPPALSVPLGVGLTVVLWLLLGAPVAPGLMMGVVSGYMAYDLIHYCTHHRPMRGPLGRAWKRYHMRHHFADPHRGYGVSSPLWDVVFRTRPRADGPARERRDRHD